MAVTVGTRFGPYEILAPLGAGGMGEVFRARDTKLGRDVALKTLPPALASNPERLARFEREAKTLAALNHPNVAQIYGVEESDGATAIVMELVDGESLDTRIARGKLPIAEAIEIARQVADALEAAHEQGIIHRDLKPANIAVANDGRVKVLDFGLAKAIEPPGTSIDVMNSPTITSPAMLSGVGMILGTAAYMSPEQAKGRPADKRSDVWAFGCVLYEMLTGVRPFAGDDVTDTLAHVLRGDPDWSALPVDVPRSVTTLLKGCLVKERARRVAGLAAAQFVLGAGTENGANPAAQRAKPFATGALLPAAIGLALGAVLVGGVMWNARPKPVPASPVRFSIAIPEGASQTGQPAISADGSMIAYATEDRIYVRLLSEVAAHPVTGTEGSGLLASPAFSPNNQFLAFYSIRDGSIMRIPVAGGVPQKLCGQVAAAGLSWTPTGIIFFTLSQGVQRVPETGGEPQILVPHNPDDFAAWPRLLPDNRTLIYSAAPSTRAQLTNKARIVVQPIGGPPKTVVTGGGTGPRYLPTGHLVYAVGGVLTAVPFDLRTLSVNGPAVPVLEGIRRSGATSGALFDVSENGSLVYVEGPATGTGPAQAILATLDANDTLEVLHLPPAAYDHPRVSPDGSRLVYSIEEGKDSAVWVYEMSGGSAPRRLTFQGANRFPMWSVDGERVVFQSDREGTPRMYWQRADGSDRAVALSKSAPGTVEIPNAWSADGKILMYSTLKDSRYDLWTVRVADGTTEPFGDVRSVYAPTPAISPDGRWVAYGSWRGDGSGGIFIEPFPRTGTKYQVSSGAGIHPIWSRDGKQLVYAPLGNSLTAVPVTTQPFALGNPVELPRHGISTLGPAAERRYDFTRDGKLLGIFTSTDGQAAGAAPQEYTMVLNWFDLLKARIAASTSGRER